MGYPFWLSLGLGIAFGLACVGIHNLRKPVAGELPSWASDVDIPIQYWQKVAQERLGFPVKLQISRALDKSDPFNDVNYLVGKVYAGTQIYGISRPFIEGSRITDTFLEMLDDFEETLRPTQETCSMKPKDLLTDLEAGDRTMEFVEGKPSHPETFPDAFWQQYAQGIGIRDIQQYRDQLDAMKYAQMDNRAMLLNSPRLAGDTVTFPHFGSATLTKSNTGGLSQFG